MNAAISATQHARTKQSYFCPSVAYPVIRPKIARTRYQLAQSWLAFIVLGSAYTAEAIAQAALPREVGVKRIYIAPDDHTDFMWTADEKAYETSYLSMLDYYIEQADRTANQPIAYRTKWHADGSHWFYVYERYRSPEQMATLMDRVRDGSFSLPLNTAVSTYGGVPTEAVLRGMYYAGSLERRFNVRIPLAIAMEAQTLPHGLGALWAGAGAKYSWKGVCACLTKIDTSAVRPNEIYWWKGDDGSRLLMKWQTNLGGDRVIGSYAEARDPEKQIDFVSNDPAFKKRYPYDVIGIFGHGWDDLATTTDLFPNIARSASGPDRRVISSNMIDFFQDFERVYGDSLPEYSGSFGNEWDLYTSSVQGLASRVRRAVEKLRTAEALASVVSLQDHTFMDGRQSARTQAWVNLGLFWEHDWTADSPYVSKRQRTIWARRLVAEIEAYVDKLHGDGLISLTSMINAPKAADRFVVFNPLGWSRSDAADLPITHGGPVHVIDVATGEEVDSQIERREEAAPEAPRLVLRIWAEKLPPVGYKVFEVRSGPSNRQQVTATATPAVDPSPWNLKSTLVESPFYKLHLAGRGAFLSLKDKMRNDLELLRYGFDTRTNDLGIDLDGVTNVESAGSVSITLRSVSDNPLAHVSRTTLYRRSPRIDIRNEITQNFDGTHAWAFSFDIKNPTVRHEEIGVVATAKLKEDGGHYSSTLSNLEWLSINHFADISSDDGVGITLSNADLAFMKLGKSITAQKTTFLDTKTPEIRVLAGGQIDGPQAGIAKQGGESHFLNRFALQPHSGYEAAHSMRVAMEHQNPPVGARLTGSGMFPEKQFSLLRNSNPNVLLWSVKPSEDGLPTDLTVRVWNVGKDPQSYSLSIARPPRSVQLATHIETPLEKKIETGSRIGLDIKPSQIQTILLKY